MKTLISLCLGVLAFNVSWTQSITALDSFHLYIYEDDAWQLSSGEIYSHLADGSVSSNQFKISDASQRDFISIVDTKFDSNGNEIENLVTVHDQSTDVWSPTSMTTYGYDANNNLLNKVRQLWDETMGAWVNVEKWEYEQYDAFNNFGKTENFNHTEAAGWILANSIELDNAYENMLLDTVSTVRNGEQWYTRAFDYSSDDLLMENRTIFYFNGEVNHLTKTTYEYNDDLRSWRFYDSYTPGGGETDYAPRYRDNFDYTTGGDLLSQINEDYDADADEYLFDEKLVYFYPQSTGIEDLNQLSVSVQWRNSQFNQLEIQVGDLAANQDHLLSIFDASGRIVKNLRISQSSQWQGSYSIASGIHYVVIRSESGATHTEKVIVH